jgi:hypothetical protein
MSELVPCHGCARHIRASERSCPFCGIPREPVFTARPALPRPISRAAVVLAGAVAATSCGKRDADPPLVTAPTTSPSPTTVDTNPATVYGPAPVFDTADAGIVVAPSDPSAPDNGGKGK